MIKVGIVGGTGYTGSELARLVLAHPALELACITSRQDAGQPVASQWPQFAARSELRFSAPDPATLTACDLVFFATPHGTAMAMAPGLLEAGVKVVDLSADFRLRSIPEFERWYGMPHTAAELLEEAVYGLPELNRERIRRARLVACPGCYPTATILGFAPLLEHGLLDPRTLVADAKSGVSGAGRKLAMGVLYGEVAENFKAYGVDGHRHLPEIAQVLAECAGAPLGLCFVPHLLPMFRGLQATLYATVTRDPGDLVRLFRERYADHPFIFVHDADGVPETRAVRGSNACHIGLRYFPEQGRVVVFSVIDNLVKGAAGQALQNANLMCGLAEDAGLPGDPFFP
jgi:N-acetyl-gamma-glutamyl-phosphate reductase